jgi:hypothetical protein
MDKSKKTLKEIIYFTVDPDLFIDHLDPENLEVLEVRNMTESVAHFLTQTKKLTRLKLLQVASDSEMFKLCSALPHLQSLKQLVLKFNKKLSPVLNQNLITIIS